MTDTAPNTVPPKTAEGMPRRDFIRKSLVASGGVFTGMALGEKMSLPDLYWHNPTTSASGGDGSDSTSGDTDTTSWFTRP